MPTITTLDGVKVTTADGTPWQFEQLAGPKKTLVLSGWAAPFGRPRQNAVVRKAVRWRSERTRYPGSTNVTRHLFGLGFEDVELTGRFRSRALGGDGTAQKKMDEVLAFVADGQPVRFAWGGFVVGTGFIVGFDPGIEGATVKGACEVEWKMQIEVDDYPGLQKAKAPKKPKPPGDYTQQILAAFRKISTDLDGLEIVGDISELIGTILAQLEGAVSSVVSLADTLAEWKNATFAELNRLRGSAQNVLLFASNLREVVEQTRQEAVAFNDRTQELETLTKGASVTEQIRQMSAQTRNLDAEADRAIIGKLKGTYVAKDGDTWESISTKEYGSPDRANDIRDANLASPGEQVVPGREYLIPV